MESRRFFFVAHINNHFSECTGKIIHLPCDSVSHVLDSPWHEENFSNKAHITCTVVLALVVQQEAECSAQKTIDWLMIAIKWIHILKGMFLNKQKSTTSTPHHPNLSKVSGCTSGWLSRWWKASLSSWWSITMSRTLVVTLEDFKSDLEIPREHWKQHMEV